MGSLLDAAKYNSLLQGAASLDRLGTTALQHGKFDQYIYQKIFVFTTYLMSRVLKPLV